MIPFFNPLENPLGFFQTGFVFIFQK
ncbi:hypothetical protein DAD63_00620 [Streptococcus agalactiae]|nr:hypothetical protein CWQ22_06300 [Streptococcus agalactiae]ATZ85935.1 hypothetical protein CWQ20_06565 [Streptococcus agalactiae]ATZ90413.1 hypothetical protein CWQ23_06300 [Streptococcus agalactiae]ATZ92462.1 hypothetical protein CWQ21_06870 [Streptococcus agalactiae]AVJ52248.1 hypothetical protein A6J82_11575 [Streptococcus agalactiae]